MFVGGLKLDLTLTIEGSTFSIETGNVKNFDLLYNAYGFHFTLDWWRVLKNQTVSDTLLPKFPGNDLIEVEFEIERQFDPKGESIKLKGVVVERRFEERVFPTLSGDPVLQRHYHISVTDYLTSFWRQHYPYRLYVDSKIQDVVDDNKPSKPSGLQLDYTGCVEMTGGNPSKTSPMFFLGLGQRTESQASFYDFLMWYLKKNNAGMYFDGELKYTFLSDKAEGTPVEFPEEEGVINYRLPELPRYKIQILNTDTSTTTSASTLEVANTEAVEGLEKDLLFTTPIASEATKFKTLKEQDTQFEQPYLEIEYEKYPTVDLSPGTIYKFTDGSTNTSHYNKQFRMRELRILARAESQLATSDTDLDTNSYQIHMTSLLESKAEPHHQYPNFVTPRWPVPIEATIFSDEGTETETTYQFETNDDKSVDEYGVEVPVFKDKNNNPMKIKVLLEPNHFSGHFYFPLYKGERVLLDMSFDHASFGRYLDWRAKLPLATQGDQIFMGKSDKTDEENRTILKHVYEEQKPVFSIDRVNAKDTQLISVSEGQVFIHTKEEK